MDEYWSQWSHEELNSMQGIESHDRFDDYDDYQDDIPEREEGCSCGNVCMECLGMSWSDFM